jgi:hypothetical protein
MWAMRSRKVFLGSILGAIALTLGPASPLVARDGTPYYPDEPLCQSMFRFAESARHHARSVKYRKGRGAIAAAECRHDGGAAGRELCDLLTARAARLAMPPLALDALFCIGIREPRPSNPEAIVGHSFYTTGTFESAPPHFANGNVRLEISLDGRRQTARPWISVTAIPLR